jgi:membrane-bound lytic murein transglycosylase B
MGRHSKKSETAAVVRRRSLLALSGLVPAGVVSATTGTGAVDGTTLEHVPEPLQPNDTGSMSALGTIHAVMGHGVPTRTSAAEKAAQRFDRMQPGHTVEQASTPLEATGEYIGVPPIALAAYETAAQRMSLEDAHCGLTWELLAGIGRVESHHAENGNVDSNGTALEPIYGPSLDGSLPGNEVIPDGAGGYQRAEGPMQFMPGTWNRYAAPGSDPQNLFDAAYTAGRYLCSGGGDLRDPSQRTQAILRYNDSMAYVADVMSYAVGYGNGVAAMTPAAPQFARQVASVLP